MWFRRWLATKMPGCCFSQPPRAGVSWQRIEQVFNAGMVEDPDNPGIDILQMGEFEEKNDRVTLSSYLFF